MNLLRRARSGAGPSRALVSVEPDGKYWQHLYFAAHRLDTGGQLRGSTGTCETALVVLGGRCRVQAGERSFQRVGARADVWDQVPPAALLLPPGLSYEVQAESAVHLVVAGAVAAEGGEPHLITPAEVPVEQRGSGQTARTIHHVLGPAAPAARLIIFEVYTPGGNWSSFPPHKHDTEDPPRESALEELYYYQVNPPRGFALQRVYTPDRSLDETIAAGDGDLVLVPRGYHVVAATPGHACWYLNVMAGHGRAWRFTLDPDYASLMDWQPPAAPGASAA